jgi:hypothetical protein
VSDAAGAIARLSEIVLECPRPLELGQFYARLTGWAVVYSDEEWVAVGPDTETRPRLAFQRAPGYRRPVWPDPGSSMQLHLDFQVDDLDAAERAALAIGATKFDEQPSPQNFRVMADPVGHPFCLCLH